MRNDSVIQIRCKRVTLATLGLFMHEKGITPRSYSDLCRLALEGLAEMVTSQNPTLQVSNPSDATRILEELGLGNLNPQNRGKKNLMENLQLENFERSQTQTAQSLSVQEIVAKAMAEESMREEEVPDIKEIRKALGIIPNNVKEDKNE